MTGTTERLEAVAKKPVGVDCCTTPPAKKIVHLRDVGELTGEGEDTKPMPITTENVEVAEMSTDGEQNTAVPLKLKGELKSGIDCGTAYSAEAEARRKDEAKVVNNDVSSDKPHKPSNVNSNPKPETPHLTQSLKGHNRRSRGKLLKEVKQAPCEANGTPVVKAEDPTTDGKCANEASGTAEERAGEETMSNDCDDSEDTIDVSLALTPHAELIDESSVESTARCKPHATSDGESNVKLPRHYAKGSDSAALKKEVWDSEASSDDGHADKTGGRVAHSKASVTQNAFLSVGKKNVKSPPTSNGWTAQQSPTSAPRVASCDGKEKIITTSKLNLNAAPYIPLSSENSAANQCGQVMPNGLSFGREDFGPMVWDNGAPPELPCNERNIHGVSSFDMLARGVGRYKGPVERVDFFAQHQPEMTHPHGGRMMHTRQLINNAVEMSSQMGVKLASPRSVTMRGLSPMPSESIRTDQYFVKLLVPGKFTELLTMRLKERMKNTCAKMSVSLPSQFFPGTQSRILAISATNETVIYDILEFVCRVTFDRYKFLVHEAVQTQRATTSVGGVVSILHKNGLTEPPSVTLAIPRGLCGYILGKNGSWVKNLRNMTAATIFVSPLFVLPNEACSERTIIISSESERAVTTALTGIVHHMLTHPDVGPCRLMVYRERQADEDTNSGRPVGLMPRRTTRFPSPDSMMSRDTSQGEVRSAGSSYLSHVKAEPKNSELTESGTSMLGKTGHSDTDQIGADGLRRRVAPLSGPDSEMWRNLGDAGSNRVTASRTPHSGRGFTSEKPENATRVSTTDTINYGILIFAMGCFFTYFVTLLTQSYTASTR